MQQQARTGLPITRQLDELFPDIEGQLCSRHSTLFSKLKTNFNRLYDNMEPQYYIVVKGDCQIVDESILETRVSMGMENGIIILVSKTYQQSQLFINSNHFSQQLIFTQNGDLQQGLNNLSPDITTIIKACNQGLAQTQLFGGIFYIHANIPEDRFHYNQLLLIGIYLGTLVINGRVGKVEKDDVIRSMAQLGCMGSQQAIRRRFDHYVNLMFDVTVTQHKTENQINNFNTNNNQNQLQIPLQLPYVQTIHQYPRLGQDYKLMFCRLDLAKQDMRYEKVRRVDVRNRKNQLLSEINKQFPQITSLLELSKSTINLHKQVTFTSTYIRSQEAKTVQQLECQDQQEILRQPYKQLLFAIIYRFLNALIAEIKIIQSFLKNPNEIQVLISSLWDLQSKQLQLYTDDVIDLVQRMKQDLQIKACMIVDRNFLMILVHKNKHTELLIEVKHKMNKGELKSKSLFKIQEEEIIQQRFHIDKSIGQKLFTTVPSKGVAIFDPAEAIWFQ